MGHRDGEDVTRDLWHRPFVGGQSRYVGQDAGAGRVYACSRERVFEVIGWSSWRCVKVDLMLWKRDTCR